MASPILIIKYYRLLSATRRETAYVTTPGSTDRLWDASQWVGDVTKAQGHKAQVRS